ncbi:hypothetical protein [Synechococcus elongatus]|uniref:Uncharacterized protein n=1 Tax=Synechococcus elongatus PCC 11802 TaxID=2283154 RepID=A0AAT9JVH2_SYNEL|nr:hypothetical protein [Synechococcus elongatus]QFZ92661.1 hypothetical protein EKO22_10215 [Synechococcus elongatus PCC 11802]
MQKESEAGCRVLRWLSGGLLLTVLLGGCGLLSGFWGVEAPLGETAPPVATPPLPPVPSRFQDRVSPRENPELSNRIAANPAAYRAPIRVANRSDHPVRVVLQQTAIAQNTEPVHWDFAPQEVGSQGLLLSLPQGKLQLQPQDVLVAFALDGSRLYWGPYQVGRDRQPHWNPTTQEWQLLLEDPEPAPATSP